MMIYVEGRWLHDSSVTGDYVKFWFDDRQLDESFGGRANCNVNADSFRICSIENAERMENCP